jgi:3',5'-nucleoside bisphosphate phosphatase
MKTNSKFLTGLVIFFVIICGIRICAQTADADPQDRTISFPDLPGFKTLVCDFHQHTVFSDGNVWPNIRVREALADGLEAISITDHIEYQPHQKDIPDKDRNRSFQIALEAAKDKNLLVINGSEITRAMPPGHANAIFLKDANRLTGLDSMEVFREAERQGAFIIWNHPHWYPQNPNGTADLTDMHRQLIREGLINGIEVVNEHSYSDEALQIAIDNNLTIMGASDIHDLIDWEYNISKGAHRPVTLVFASENNEKALRDALINRRTAVWFENTLIGRSDWLVPLILQSVQVKKAEALESSGKSTLVSVIIRNESDADFILENKGKFTFYDHTGLVTLKAHSLTTIIVKPLKTVRALDLTFSVLNAFTAPGTHPLITIHADVTGK